MGRSKRQILVTVEIIREILKFLGMETKISQLLTYKIDSINKIQEYKK